MGTAIPLETSITKHSAAKRHGGLRVHELSSKYILRVVFGRCSHRGEAIRWRSWFYGRRTRTTSRFVVPGLSGKFYISLTMGDPTPWTSTSQTFERSLNHVSTSTSHEVCRFANHWSWRIGQVAQTSNSSLDNTDTGHHCSIDLASSLLLDSLFMASWKRPGAWCVACEQGPYVPSALCHLDVLAGSPFVLVSRVVGCETHHSTVRSMDINLGTLKSVGMRLKVLTYDIGKKRPFVHFLMCQRCRVEFATPPQSSVRTRKKVNSTWTSKVMGNSGGNSLRFCVCVSVCACVSGLCVWECLCACLCVCARVFRGCVHVACVSASARPRLSKYWWNRNPKRVPVDGWCGLKTQSLLRASSRWSCDVRSRACAIPLFTWLTRVVCVFTCLCCVCGCVVCVFFCIVMVFACCTFASQLTWTLRFASTGMRIDFWVCYANNRSAKLRSWRHRLNLIPTSVICRVPSFVYVCVFFVAFCFSLLRKLNYVLFFICRHFHLLSSCVFVEINQYSSHARHVSMPISASDVTRVHDERVGSTRFWWYLRTVTYWVMWRFFCCTFTFEWIGGCASVVICSNSGEINALSQLSAVFSPQCVVQCTLHEFAFSRSCRVGCSSERTSMRLLTKKWK